MPNKFYHVDLVELDMLDFDVILGMDWLHASFAFIDCRTRVVWFKSQMNPLMSGRVGIQSLELASYLVEKNAK